MVVGPPGVGKNTLMNDALAELPWLKHLVTCTTRSPRPGELQDGDYHFVSMARFHQMVAENELLEWQEVHPGRHYGVPRAAVERGLAAGDLLIADLDVLGAACLQSFFPAATDFIFIRPPSLPTLRRRMRARGDGEGDIRARVRRVQMEMQYLALADHVILNDDLERSRRRLRRYLRERRERLRLDPEGFRRRRFLAQLLISDGDDALLREDGAPLPARHLREREAPHRAALRCLEDLPGAGRGCLCNPSGHAGSLVPPVSVEVHDRAGVHDVRFTWIYRLDAPLARLPAGWRRQRVSELDQPAWRDCLERAGERQASQSP